MFNQSFIKDLLPVKYRKPRIIAWLKALCVRPRLIFEEFQSFVAATNECIAYNSQTASLEAFLRFKFSEPLITIVNDFSDVEPVFTYWLREDQVFHTVYWLSEQDSEPVYWLSEYNDVDLNWDFIVEAPTYISALESLLKAYINKLKLVGKRYKIEYV